MDVSLDSGDNWKNDIFEESIKRSSTFLFEDIARTLKWKLNITRLNDAFISSSSFEEEEFTELKYKKRVFSRKKHLRYTKAPERKRSCVRNKNQKEVQTEEMQENCCTVVPSEHRF